MHNLMDANEHDTISLHLLQHGYVDLAAPISKTSTIEGTDLGEHGTIIMAWNNASCSTWPPSTPQARGNACMCPVVPYVNLRKRILGGQYYLITSNVLRLGASPTAYPSPLTPVKPGSEIGGHSPRDARSSILALIGKRRVRAVRCPDFRGTGRK